MIHRSAAALILGAGAGVFPSTGAEQTATQQPRPAAAPLPERAVRRDIPLTTMIRRAFAAGTRDSSGRPGRRYWQLWTEYTIDARLDPPRSTITGRARVVIHNPSDSALGTLVLRLDQNFFRPTAARGRTAPEVTEGLQLTRLAIDGQSLDVTRPPLLQETFRTSVELPLPRPIAARGTGVVEAEWSFRVPDASDGVVRMGRLGDTLYQVAQWFPRVAVFDDLRGWDRERYLGQSEFYNNFGRFDVRLEVPAGWLVGATGVLQNPESVLTPAVRERLARVLDSDSVRSIVAPAEIGTGTAAGADGRLVWHFVADSVSDFAWAASSRYVWDATRATIPGKGAVPLNLLYLAGNAQKYAQAGADGRHALEFYSRLWMPYAFPQLTLVDGPEMAMEYPMLIMALHPGIVDHEVGHQWWPMMVGVNETWYPFMDEGFNEYMNLLSSADQRQEPSNLDGLGQQYGGISGDEREAPLMWNANATGSLYYEFQAYTKAKMMLSMLGGVVGDSAVWRAMGDFARAWRYKHPTPWDFAFFMNRSLGQDLSWFWYYWLFTTESVDGSIQQVATCGQRTLVTVHHDGQMPAPVVLQVRFAPMGPAIRPMPNSRMIDSVTALVTYPVDVWFAGSRTFTAKLDFGKRRIERLTLDPARRFPDRDSTDNLWPRTPATAGTSSEQRQP